MAFDRDSAADGNASSDANNDTFLPEDSGLDEGGDVDATGDVGTDADGSDDCLDGCLIDDVCHADGALKPDNACEHCDPGESVDSWSPNDGATCDDLVFCNGNDTCDGAECSVHSGDPCEDDGLYCTGVEFCDVDSDSCSATGDPCEAPASCSTEVDQCACPAGFTGEDCGTCVVYVNGTEGAAGAAGDTWEHAVDALQTGIALAAGAGCQVWVAAGTYQIAVNGEVSDTVQLAENIDVYGGFAGGEVIFEQRDWTQNETTLHGVIGPINEPTGVVDHVVTGADGAVLDGFTITTDLQGVNTSGLARGMLNAGVSVTVRNCNFDENGAMGGSAMGNTNATVTIDACTFIDNLASSNMFGAGTAAAIYNDSSTVLIEDSVFRGNMAMGSGGAIFNQSSTLRVRNSRFERNGVLLGNGGAVASQVGSTVSLEGCLFEGNTGGFHFLNGPMESWGHGGAIYDLSSDTSITNCTLVGNSAYYGGAVYSDGCPSIANSVFLLEPSRGKPAGSLVRQRARRWELPFSGPGHPSQRDSQLGARGIGRKPRG